MSKIFQYALWAILAHLTTNSVSLSAARACEAAPAAIVDLDIGSFYSDPKHSIVDPVKKAQHDAIAKPLEDFARGISKSADRFRADPVKNKADAACAISWLTGWASGRSLLGEMKTNQAFYERKWMLAGMALTFAKVRDQATASDKAAILKYLSEIADLTIEHSDKTKAAKNNHFYWEGLAVGAAGVLTGNAKQIAWAKACYAFAMTQIQDDGALPLEMARGARALNYHAFSAAPLTLMASILDLKTDRLKLLVDLVFRNLKTSSEVDRKAAAVQEVPGKSEIAWLEVELRRKPDAAIEAYLTPLRPLGQSKLGGDLTTRGPLEK